MKHPIGFLAAVFAVMLTVMLLAPVASAQQTLRVTIPFAFTANHQVLPAGSYSVERQIGTWAPYLVLVNRSTGRVIGPLIAHTTGSDQTHARSSLVFYSTGHKYWLTEVHFGYSKMTSRLATQPKPEPELAKSGKDSTIEIAAR